MKIEDIARIRKDSVISVATFRSDLPDDLDMKKAGNLLASFPGQIRLENWRKLPQEFIESLVKHEGPAISFVDMSGGGGFELSVQKAETLATYKGELNIDTLRLNYEKGHSRLDPHNPKRDDLNDQDIKDEITIAKVLSLHNGGILSLPNLKELSILAAEQLLKHKSPVYLENLVDDEDSSDFSPEIHELIAEASKRWPPESHVRGWQK
jgi:hypothetical protein